MSYGRRLAIRAEGDPNGIAIVMVRTDGTESTMTWAELHSRSNRVAHALARRGVGPRSLVVISLPNSAEHYVASLATWKVGACTLSLNPRMPAIELEALVSLASPALIVTNGASSSFPTAAPAELEDPGLPDTDLEDVVSRPGKAIASGGSTGRPKIILETRPWARVPGVSIGWAGFHPNQVQLVAGPLYHNAPFGWSHMGMFDGHTLIVMERFDAGLALRLIERHRVNFSLMVPTMMQRILQLPPPPGIDLSSVEGILHTAAPCPPWVKRGWIDLVGAPKVYEGFGGTEGVGLTAIRGDEWLEHPGSVGRPVGTEMRILDEDWQEVPPGVVGEIFMRPEANTGDPYAYIGEATARRTADGFTSLGDMGWVDEQGYLYLADRRVDLIITGGANVYPAEVEAALGEHPEVADVVVVGVPDNDWGKRVHAVVQPADSTNPPSEEELDAFARVRLAAYKVPKSYEFRVALPRDESGKIRRSAIAAEVAEAAAAPGARTGEK